MKYFSKVKNDSHIKETLVSLRMFKWSYKYCKSVIKLQTDKEMVTVMIL